ncbi:MAG TPA: hypothetical protein VIT01_09935 [Acidimicrobiales bacterium]
MRTELTGTVLILVLAAVACSSDDATSGTTAVAETSTSTTAVADTVADASCFSCLPAGPFTSFGFVPELTITIPDDGWQIGEDTSAEVKMNLVDDPDEELKFLPQPIPVTNLDQEVVEGIEPTPDGLVAWLQSNPDLVVGEPIPRTIAGDIEATAVDVSVAPTAENGDPGCPPGLEPCVNFFAFVGPDYDFGLAIASQQTVRLIFAPVTVDGSPTTMLIVLDPGTPDRLEHLVAVTDPMLDELVVAES